MIRISISKYIYIYGVPLCIKTTHRVYISSYFVTVFSSFPVTSGHPFSRCSALEREKDTAGIPSFAFQVGFRV